MRFAPSLVGTWTWNTSFSESNDTGLHAQSGRFSATPYDGANPLFRHGVVRPNAGGRFFEHDDGAPFYW